MAILQDVSAKALQAQLEALRAENEKLKAKVQAKAQSMVKVRANIIGETLPSGTVGKGNVSVLGIQRFPLTLYPNQWRRLLAMKDDIEACIVANEEGLSFGKED